MTRSDRGSVLLPRVLACLSGFVRVFVITATIGAVTGQAQEQPSYAGAPRMAEIANFGPMRPLLKAVSGPRFSGGTAVGELAAFANVRKNLVAAGAPSAKAAALPGFTIPPPAVYTGPKMGPYLRENPHFKESGELLHGPRAALIAASDRAALETDYSARLLDRDALLPQADGLDLREMGIAERHNALRDTAIALVADIERFVNAGQPNNLRAGLAARAAKFDADVLALESEKQALPGAWDSFSGLAAAWVRKAADLLNQVHAVFARVPEVGWCVLEKIEKNSENRVYNCKARCNRNGSIQLYEFPPFNTGRPCGVGEGDFFRDPYAGVGVSIQ